MKPKEIKSLRTFLGMNQQEFAHVMNCTNTTISNWETGSNRPTRMALAAMAEIKRNPAEALRKVMIMRQKKPTRCGSCGGELTINNRCYVCRPGGRPPTRNGKQP